MLPLDLSILEAGLDLRRRGVGEFYGFMVAREIREREGARLLTAYGTLYKALDQDAEGWPAGEPLGRPAHRSRREPSPASPVHRNSRRRKRAG